MTAQHRQRKRMLPMTSNDRVSVSELQELYEKCNHADIYTLHVDTGNSDNRFEFQVKHRIGIGEAIEIVDSVCNAVVEPGTGAYHPERKDYALRMAVLKAYTNICLPNGDECWDLVYGTPIFAMVTGRDKCPISFECHEYDDNRIIDVEQYEQLVAAIEQRIAHALESKKATCLIRHVPVIKKRGRIRK